MSWVEWLLCSRILLYLRGFNVSISRKYGFHPGHPGQGCNSSNDGGLSGPGGAPEPGTHPGQNVTPGGGERYGRLTQDSSKRKKPRSRADQPPVICVGSSGRLVRIATVAVELGLTENRARLLMGRLGVVIRPIGDKDYVHLFALETALWRWFGLTEDFRLMEFAHCAYRDLERRGVERTLQRLCGKRLGRRLRMRSLDWVSIHHWWKANRKSTGGRPPSIETAVRAEGLQLGPTSWHDPAVEVAGACPDPLDRL